MIFLSAQPDDYYFLWQLKLQIYNFRLNNIAPENIHILIGYHPARGLQKHFMDFIAENPGVNICPYPDTRENKLYQPSIRPHIIAKHLKVFPKLQQEAIFYHDSDIVFKGLPDFETLNSDNIWYASETASYLNAQYIKSTAGEEIFKQMCKIVGITTDLVEANDTNAGGAQYFLKNTQAGFWEKIENDCELMYDLLTANNNKYGFCTPTNTSPTIQAWCTDMWVIWWNAILNKQEFQVHPELDFAWVNSKLTQLDKCKILHYTGSVEKGNTSVFSKTDYVNYPPFYADLSKTDQDLCSWYLKSLIDDYLSEQRVKRIDLLDVSFLIPVKIDSEDRLENVYAVTGYLANNFNTNIILTEVGESPKIDVSKLPPETNYYFVEDGNPKFHHTKYNNQMILKATTPYIAMYDADVVFPVNQITEAVHTIRGNKFSAVSPYDGNFLGIDALLKAMFIKIQDVGLFEENQGKAGTGVKRSYGGAVFLNRQHYITAGVDNENFNVWGPEDIERIKRLTILGYSIKRVKGNLYHLFHTRGINSSYQSLDEMENLMSEYIKVCNYSKTELQAYVNTWLWVPKVLTTDLGNYGAESVS